MPPSTLPSDTEKLQNIGMLLGSIYSSYLEGKRTTRFMSQRAFIFAHARRF
jgi:hypothetical protein